MYISACIRGQRCTHVYVYLSANICTYVHARISRMIVVRDRVHSSIALVGHCHVLLCVLCVFYAAVRGSMRSMRSIRGGLFSVDLFPAVGGPR
jgi:hypothetical protein